MSIPVDDQVLPAITNINKHNQPSEYAPGQEYNEEESKEGEPISNDKRGFADPLT